MSGTATKHNLSIFKVEYVTTREGKVNGGVRRSNATMWVLVEGDAADAIAAVKVEHPDAIVHVVRRHASGASVLVSGSPAGGES